MQVALLAGQVQSGLTQALTLVEKYGHASRLENLFRSTGKAEVERKMGDAAAHLGSLAEQVWDLITPDNTIKRSLLAAQPITEDRPLGAVLMDRRRLRPACQRPITALAVLPEGDEEDGYEGCVAWASSRGIKVTRLGPTISAVMDGSVDAPPVTTLTGGSPGERRMHRKRGVLQPGGRQGGVGCHAGTWSDADGRFKAACGPGWGQHQQPVCLLVVMVSSLAH
jgi:hypothetical protein